MIFCNNRSRPARQVAILSGRWMALRPRIPAPLPGSSHASPLSLAALAAACGKRFDRCNDPGPRGLRVDPKAAADRGPGQLVDDASLDQRAGNDADRACNLVEPGPGVEPRNKPVGRRRSIVALGPRARQHATAGRTAERELGHIAKIGDGVPFRGGDRTGGWEPVESGSARARPGGNGARRCRRLDLVVLSVIGRWGGHYPASTNSGPQPRRCASSG